MTKLNVEELNEAAVVEADEKAETTGIEEVEVEFDEIVETTGEEGGEEMAEVASGHEADAEGLGDEAADNGAASEGPAARNSQNGGDEDVGHTCATPEESCMTTYEECQTVSMDTHNEEEAASEARPQTTHVPERVSASLEGEREGSATTDRADDGESKGVVDDPHGHVDYPGGCAEPPVARTKHMATPEGGEMTTNGVVEADSPRPSEDLGDATDDDARHPDEPTEPPDDAESARVRGGEERIEERVSRMLTGRANETAESGGATGARTESDSDEGVPGSAEDDPEDQGGATDRRKVVEVEPGSETKARRSGSVAHEDVDADLDREAGEARRDAQVEGESAGTRRDVSIERERGSASAHERSTTTVEETDQRPSSDDDIPGVPPDTPEPPDVTAQRRNEPPSAELEGEWEVPASCNAGPTAGETDVSGPSVGDEDPRNRPKAVRNASERERKRSKGRSREDSPEGGQDDRGDLSGEAHASGVSRRIKDARKRLRKLQNASKRVRKRSERKGQGNSPRRGTRRTRQPRWRNARARRCP